jgi:hypothetical protein
MRIALERAAIPEAEQKRTNRRNHGRADLFADHIR